MGLFDRFKGGGDPASDEISHADLAAALQSNSCALIDVRESDEFASGHIAGAENRPLSSFDATRLPQDKPVVLICRSGARSGQALARTRAAGHAYVRHYRGGVVGWAGAGGKLV